MALGSIVTTPLVAVKNFLTSTLVTDAGRQLSEKLGKKIENQELGATVRQTSVYMFYTLMREMAQGKVTVPGIDKSRIIHAGKEIPERIRMINDPLERSKIKKTFHTLTVHGEDTTVKAVVGCLELNERREFKDVIRDLVELAELPLAAHPHEASFVERIDRYVDSPFWSNIRDYVILAKHMVKQFDPGVEIDWDVVNDRFEQARLHYEIASTPSGSLLDRITRRLFG